MRVVDLQEPDRAPGEVSGHGPGPELAGIVEVGAPPEGREREEPYGEHVAWLGALDPDRADDRVRPLARVLPSPLGHLRAGDARLEPVGEVGPGVRIDPRVAGVDLDDVR